MKKALLLIDCQYDFIDGGSLAAPGSLPVMDALAVYISSCSKDVYSHVIMTADFHPYGHCSFKKWPVHCLQFTHGGAIYQPVYEASLKLDPQAVILTKGNLKNKDEYSILQNAKNGKKLLHLLDKWGIEEIDVCGICGDICVLDTVKDLLKTKWRHHMKVLPQFSPSLDGGTALNKLIKDYNL